MAFIEPYEITVIVLGLTGLIMFVQLLVADVIGIRLGHTPGVAVEQSHNSSLFRASRAIANSNESVGILVLFVLFALFSRAEPSWLNTSAIVYFAGRVAHMVFYYSNLKLMRSVAFGVACLGLLGIFVTGAMNWL